MQTVKPMQIEEIKKQLVHNGLLEIVILMGELRCKVDAISTEELEKITGVGHSTTFDGISTSLCNSEADLCDIIGDVMRHLIDTITNPTKKVA